MTAGRQARANDPVVASCLLRATSRAKSDVANKLVSMLLHALSARVVREVGYAVSDPRYAATVETFFGNRCPYCARDLPGRRVAVEHLDGMNRFRVGLHVPGNVLVACHECNTEKRRDDQKEKLVLADAGWASFLSHDFSKCPAHCKSCRYWGARWPDGDVSANLRQARSAIDSFRQLDEHRALLDRSERIRQACAAEIQKIYREGQDFASQRIDAAAESIYLRS